MAPDSLNLLCSALVILVVGYLILSRYLPKWAALLIALVKAAIPFIYFGFFFGQGGWTLYDDVRYYDVGASILDLGYRPWELVLDPEGRDLLAGAAASRHTLYYLWNVAAQFVIGHHYYAAVFFNIGLTFVSGLLMFHTLRLLNFSARFLRGLLAFHMLHWDYLSWTSLLNVKETLVEALIIISVCCIIRFACRGNWFSLVGVAVSFLLLFSLRLYVPFLIMAAVGIWVLLQWRDPRKYLIFPVVVGFLILLYAKIAAYDQELYPHLIVVGGFRFLLTPQPWSVTPSYSFLQVPMILQWCFAVPAFVGAVQLWRRNRTARLLILAAVTFIAFYSMFPAHQGPRHRVQLVSFFALFEFQFLASCVLHRAHAPRQAPHPVENTINLHECGWPLRGRRSA